MTSEPVYIQSGTEREKIDVRLSYGIVKLFSEGLYSSPHKAIEELVANSFDAGAIRVAVYLPADFHDQGATIGVLDDGEGMDDDGLKQHWLIGKSLKRRLAELPRGRSQIGKFGIGKLATYVLANRLSHISKKDGKYFATSMNFKVVDDRGEEEVEPKAPVRISLRELTQAEAEEAVKSWTSSPAFKKCGLSIFGAKAPPSWTLAILSDLKGKVHEIRRGTLAWVLRTALPLRDDFAIFQDGEKLEPSKAGKGRIAQYVLGKDITELQKPAPDIEVNEDKNQEDPEKRFALVHKALGRISGYAETYHELLTGKSDELIGRSHGFFVYVLGRLINVRDGHFGIPPDELRHGSFGRVRVVVHMDGLDDFLQSDRERIREGPILTDAQNLLRGIFNKLRSDLERTDRGELPGAKLSRNLASSPTSISRRPIVEMVRAALHGRIKPHYISIPSAPVPADRDKFLAGLQSRADSPGEFVAGLEFVFDATNDDGIAVYDSQSGTLRINGLHPFVGAFFDEFTNKNSGLPLELFAMAEVLLESHLFESGLKQNQIDDVMNSRDQLLRHVAQKSGRRTAITVANGLRQARNDEDRLEVEVVEAFRSLGFDAARVGGKGKPDGVAKAHLSAGPEGPRRYALTLEAKSKQKDGGAVKTKDVGVAVVADHRDDFKCEHAIVVAPGFDHTPGTDSQLAKQLARDRETSKQGGAAKTITTIHVDDLARLVQLRPVKRLGLDRLRELFRTCHLPEECRAWIDRREAENVELPPYELIIKTIHELQQEFEKAAVNYGALRVKLSVAKPPYKVDTDDVLKDICKSMSSMASFEISATETTVELNQSPANVIAALESATKEHLGKKQ